MTIDKGFLFMLNDQKPLFLKKITKNFSTEVVNERESLLQI